MDNAVLTINAGSSSIKFAIFNVLADQLQQKAALVGQFDGIGTTTGRMLIKDSNKLELANEIISSSASVTHDMAFTMIMNYLDDRQVLQDILAIGHRVVHGGAKYNQAMLLNEQVINDLLELQALAPLHQPHNLSGIFILRQRLPNVPQVACFDTAFHRSQSNIAQSFAIPRKISAIGVRRYGFHGLSYEYIAQVLPQYSKKADGRVIVLHLGNGSSMTAMVGRRSVDSTMGFSTIDGLMMGTRCGSIDPGVLLFLLEKMTLVELTKMLYKESGLLGVSNLSQDMRTLLASEEKEAMEAVELFCYRIVRELGALAAAAAGLDCIVFTGGIGENAVQVREKVCLASSWLGLRLDQTANNNVKGAAAIHQADSTVEILVIPTNEEWMIASHALSLT